MPRLSARTILAAYREGLFPMGDPGTGRVAWFRPDPRAILPLDRFHVSRRLARTIRQSRFEVTSDRDFSSVVDLCAQRGREGTWITPPIRDAYVDLAARGAAHSIETWREGELAGGLYGVRIGGAFFAESMFHRRTDASKVALAALVTHLALRGFRLLDVQYRTGHLARFGVVEIPLAEYLRRIELALAIDPGWGWACENAERGTRNAELPKGSLPFIDKRGPGR